MSRQRDLNYSEDEYNFADEEFENIDAESSLFEMTETNKLKIGSLVMLKGNPCKITDVKSLKTGKHGAAKVIITGKDIATG